MGDFDACRFDFRIDNKTGLTPSKRKKSERRNVNYNTLFKCKICGSLFESRPALLEHKLEHNQLKCPVCNVKFPKRSILRVHVASAHGGHTAKAETIARMIARATMKKKVQNQPTTRRSSEAMKREKAVEPESPPPPAPVVISPPVEPPAPLAYQQPPAFAPSPQQAVPVAPPPPQPQPMLSPQPFLQPHQFWQPHQMPAANFSPPAGGGRPAPMPGMVYINVPICIGGQNGPAGQMAVNQPIPSEAVPVQPTLIPVPSVADEPMKTPKEENLIKVKTEPVDSISDNQLPSSMKYFQDLEPGEIRNRLDSYGNRSEPNIPTSVITVAPTNQFSDSFPFTSRPPTDAVAALRMAKATSPSSRNKLIYNQPSPPAEDDCAPLDFSFKPEPEKEEEALDLTCKKDEKRVEVLRERVPDQVMEDDKLAMLQEYRSDRSPGPVPSSAQDSCSSSRSQTPEVLVGAAKRKGRSGGLNNLVAKLWQTKTTKPDSECDGPSSEEVLDQRVGSYPSPGDTENFSTESSPLPPSGLDFSTRLSRLDNQPDVCVEENTSEQLSEEALHMKLPLSLGNNGGEHINVTGQQGSQQQTPKKSRDYCTIKFHTCRVCKQLFDSAEKMWEHAVTHEDFHKYKCSICKYVTACKSDLAQHKMNEHGVTHVRNFVDYSVDVRNSKNGTYNFSMKDLNNPSPKGRLVCDYPGCGKTFKEWRHLKVHGTLHTGEKPLACSLCDYACRHRSSMNWHMKSRHGLEKMKTQGNRTVYVDSKGKVVCGSTEELKIEMYSSDMPGSPLKKKTIDHLVLADNCTDMVAVAAMQNAYNEQIHVSEEPDPTTAFVMPTAPEDDPFDDDSNPMGITNIKSEANEEFMDFADDNSDKQQKGEDEPQFYTSVMKLKYMGLPDSSIEENKHQICPICKQFFESAEKMWEHRMKEHEEQTRVYCETCGWNADNKEELQCHMLSTHGKEIGEFKDFICSICGKGYSSKTGLNHHMLRHSEEGPPQFTCPYQGCISKLHSKGALKNHIRRVHLKIAPKLSCPENGCARRFDSVSALRGHQVLHSDERPLVCDYPGCDKSFRESKHLKVHRMQHTDERPLRCELCDYSCRQRNSMNWHMKSKHQMDKQVTPDGRTIYYSS